MSKTATKTRPSRSQRRGAGARRSQGRTATQAQSGASKAPATQTLSDFISDRFDDFSRSQKDVARYIIDHLDEAAFQTAEELARRANTSSSTVVRFSQALGFDGYPELQQAAIEEYRTRSPEGGGATGLFDFDQTEFESSLASDYSNLEATARKLNAEHVEASIEALAEADRVVIVALEQMAFFASYMRQLLALLDIRAEVLASSGQESIARIGRVEEGTVVVSFTAGRAHPIVVRSLKLARRRGARTVAITDATLSEVGEHADHTLYFSSNGPSYTRSTAALLALVQALTHGVYARDKAAFAERIRAFKLR